MSKPPRISGILESSLYVADLDRSRAFYERVFGFEVFMADQRMCALGVPGRQVLLLFKHGAAAAPAPGPGGVIPGHDGSGQTHLCFAIPVSALADWQAHLHGHGLAIESTLTWRFGGISLYFRDPDGHLLEVATPGLWPND